MFDKNRMKNIADLYEAIDKDGGFSDRLPNFGEEYDDNAEQVDLDNYIKHMNKPENSSFWRE